MKDLHLVKYRDENVMHWHNTSSESVKCFRGRNLRISFLFTFTLSKLLGPSHYSRFSASTYYEFIHVRQRVHVHYIPGNWYGRTKRGGSTTTSAVNRRSITAFRRREHRHAWDVTCLLEATQIRTWCLVSNIATFSDKLTSVVFCWKYQRMIISYQNSIHTYLWRQYTKIAVSHSILHEAR